MAGARERELARSLVLIRFSGADHLEIIIALSEQQFLR
jgi:hypothetical protein